MVDNLLHFFTSDRHTICGLTRTKTNWWMFEILVNKGEEQ
jgi:hypothetical protein